MRQNKTKFFNEPKPKPNLQVLWILKSCSSAKKHTLWKKIEHTAIRNEAPVTRSNSWSFLTTGSHSQISIHQIINRTLYRQTFGQRERRTKLDQLCAKFMYRCVLSFKVADSHVFNKFLKRLKPAYDPPSTQRIRTTLLDFIFNYNELQKKVDWFFADASSYTLISDGRANKGSAFG